jgi:hypothetical protein
VAVREAESDGRRETDEGDGGSDNDGGCVSFLSLVDMPDGVPVLNHTGVEGRVGSTEVGGIVSGLRLLGWAETVFRSSVGLYVSSATGIEGLKATGAEVKCLNGLGPVEG